MAIHCELTYAEFLMRLGVKFIYYIRYAYQYLPYLYFFMYYAVPFETTGIGDDFFRIL